MTVLPQQEASGLGELAQSLIFPAALFAGLFFLSRRGGAAGAKFRISLACPVGAVMNCADNTGGKY